MSLAVIKTGGKQYLVKEGDLIKVEKIEGNEGEKVVFDTLLITDEAGDKLEVGKPLLNTKVQAIIVKQGRDKKISVIKYKAKTRYSRNIGHRQAYSQVKIEKI